MIFNLTAREEKVLVRLLFAGNVLLNGNRERGEELKEYDHVCNKALKQYLQGKLRRKVKCCEIDDFKEELMLKIESLIEYYEEKCVPYALAKMLADYHYPVADYNDESYDTHLKMREFYENELLENGVKNVYIKKVE